MEASRFGEYPSKRDREPLCHRHVATGSCYSGLRSLVLPPRASGHSARWRIDCGLRIPRRSDRSHRTMACICTLGAILECLSLWRNQALASAVRHNRIVDVVWSSYDDLGWKETCCPPRLKPACLGAFYVRAERVCVRTTITPSSPEGTAELQTCPDQFFKPVTLASKGSFSLTAGAWGINCPTKGTGLAVP
jgi:hypothetical protein